MAMMDSENTAAMNTAIEAIHCRVVRVSLIKHYAMKRNGALEAHREVVSFPTWPLHPKGNHLRYPLYRRLGGQILGQRFRLQNQLQHEYLSLSFTAIIAWYCS
jgi:hypothetical protein